jgi:hypothetical protein
MVAIEILIERQNIKWYRGVLLVTNRQSHQNLHTYLLNKNRNLNFFIHIL